MARLEEMSKEELIREVHRIRPSPRRFEDPVAEQEPARLVRDLRAHQVELEMQNRELREAQSLIESSRNRYSRPLRLCARRILHARLARSHPGHQPDGRGATANAAGPARRLAPQHVHLGRGRPGLSVASSELRRSATGGWPPR